VQSPRDPNRMFQRRQLVRKPSLPALRVWTSGVDDEW
jgi:hypothetical protein